MFENREYCENCKKFEYFNVEEEIKSKDFNIGKIKYKCYKAICTECKSEIYSYVISKKNKDELNKAIKELEEEYSIIEMLKKVGNKKVVKDHSEEELLNEIRAIFLKNKKDS
ncbi:hypothetical protein JCM1393_27340 [Clostridium carnis]